MFVLFFLFFSMRCPTEFKFLFFSLSVSFHCLVVLFFSFFFIINCSFTILFFSNLISTSLCLYLNITIGSRLPVYSISNNISSSLIKLFQLLTLFFPAYFQRGAKISRVFFPKQPKLLSIQPTTFSPGKQFKIGEFSGTYHIIKTLRIYLIF